MTYSKSKRPINKVKTYLDQMVAAKGDLEFPADDPGKFAYSLREGIGASKSFAVTETGERVEPFASYSTLASKFVIRSKGSVVVCELRDSLPGTIQKDTLAKVSIPNVDNALGIIGAVLMHKAPCMVFPNASLATISDPEKFVKWANTQNYVVTWSDNHVTLTRLRDAN